VYFARSDGLELLLAEAAGLGLMRGRVVDSQLAQARALFSTRFADPRLVLLRAVSLEHFLVGCARAAQRTRWALAVVCKELVGADL
jgi:hypothetical protein